jgi:hypothetical protein
MVRLIICGHTDHCLANESAKKQIAQTMKSKTGWSSAIFERYTSFLGLGSGWPWGSSHVLSVMY